MAKFSFFSVHTITETKQSNRQGGAREGARAVDLPARSSDLARPGLAPPLCGNYPDATKQTYNLAENLASKWGPYVRVVFCKAGGAGKIRSYATDMYHNYTNTKIYAYVFFIMLREATDRSALPGSAIIKVVWLKTNQLGKHGKCTRRNLRVRTNPCYFAKVTEIREWIGRIPKKAATT